MDIAKQFDVTLPRLIESVVNSFVVGIGAKGGNFKHAIFWSKEKLCEMNWLARKVYLHPIQKHTIFRMVYKQSRSVYKGGVQYSAWKEIGKNEECSWLHSPFSNTRMWYKQPSHGNIYKRYILVEGKCCIWHNNNSRSFCNELGLAIGFEKQVPVDIINT